jgi:hypothetical protein
MRERRELMQRLASRLTIADHAEALAATFGVGHLVELGEPGGSASLMPMPASQIEADAHAGAVPRPARRRPGGVAQAVLDQVAEDRSAARIARHDLGAGAGGLQPGLLGLAAKLICGAGRSRIGNDWTCGSTAPASSLEMSRIAPNDLSSASIDRIML